MFQSSSSLLQPLRPQSVLSLLAPCCPIMALTPFFGRHSLFRDPFSSFFPDSFPSMMVIDTEPASSYAKDVQALVNTRIDWKETEDAHVICADLPGVKKEEVKVEIVDQTTLKISGERHREEVKETDKWHAVERASGKFLRSFRLPENVDPESINAKFEDGVLKVSVPKKRKGKKEGPDVKSIDISGEPTSATIDARKK